jgi:hypothetical protein
VQLLARLHPLEVDVQHAILERMALHVLQHGLLLLAIDHQIDDLRVEGLGFHQLASSKALTWIIFGSLPAP